MPSEEYDHLFDLVKKRRTIRKFKPDPLPEGCIEKIIEIARWAPSGFHTQPWEFVVVQKKEVKEAIVKALDQHAPPIRNLRPGDELPAASRASFRDAPAFIILLADWRAKTGLPGHPTEKNPDGCQYLPLQPGQRISLFASGSGIPRLGLPVVLSRFAPGSGKRNRKDHRHTGIVIHIRHVGARISGSSPRPKEPRSLGEMIHYDNCGPQDFRTDEQVFAYAQKTWGWCMSEH